MRWTERSGMYIVWNIGGWLCVTLQYDGVGCVMRGRAAEKNG